MPASIVETASKGDAINAPLDADLRNANSVRVPFQSIGNRLKFLEDFYDAFFSAITFAANALWTIGNNRTLTIRRELSGAENGVLDVSGVTVQFGERVRGALFSSGFTGCANRKTATLANPASQDIDPTLYNTWVITSLTSVLNLTISATPARPYTRGEWFTVTNEDTTLPTQVVGVGSALRSFATGFRSATYVYCDVPGSGGAAFEWRQVTREPFTAA